MIESEYINIIISISVYTSRISSSRQHTYHATCRTSHLDSELILRRTCLESISDDDCALCTQLREQCLCHLVLDHILELLPEGSAQRLP